jgi:hypothetical protein
MYAPIALSLLVFSASAFATAASSSSLDPLLLRAARGESVERIPVWMMRQAGRHMQAYRYVHRAVL